MKSIDDIYPVSLADPIVAMLTEKDQTLAIQAGYARDKVKDHPFFAELPDYVDVSLKLNWGSYHFSLGDRFFSYTPANDPQEKRAGKLQSDTTMYGRSAPANGDRALWPEDERAALIKQYKAQAWLIEWLTPERISEIVDIIDEVVEEYRAWLEEYYVERSKRKTECMQIIINSIDRSLVSEGDDVANLYNKVSYDGHYTKLNIHQIGRKNIVFTGMKMKYGRDAKPTKLVRTIDQFFIEDIPAYLVKQANQNF